MPETSEVIVYSAAVRSSWNVAFKTHVSKVSEVVVFVVESAYVHRTSYGRRLSHSPPEGVGDRHGSTEK